MRSLYHPPLDDIRVEAILHALSDPVRVAIYAGIVAAGCPQTCASFLEMSDRSIPKSTLSQHFNVLREAGLIHSERHGVEMRTTTRCAEIEKKFPGLLPALLNAYQTQSRRGKKRR